MRRVRYVVATSLDGYITGPDGDISWIIMDPEIDFGALFGQFDTMLVGRRSYEPLVGNPDAPRFDMRTYVFSTTLRQADHPDVTIVSARGPEVVRELKAEAGKDIWLFGGGELFRSLAEAGVVDTVEVAVMPALTGGGIPLLPSPARPVSLQLTGHRVYGSGIVSLAYAIVSGGSV